MAVKILIGDEPYWIDSEINKVTEGIECPEMDLVKGDRLDKSVFEFLSTYSFLAGKKAAVITVANLSDADRPELRSFCCPQDSDLIIRARAYDRSKTFYKEMKKAGILFECTKSALGKKLDAFIVTKAKALGVTFGEGALQEFLFRENYQDAEEVNCHSMLSDLSSLAAVAEGGIIRKGDVERLVELHVKGDPFKVSAMIKSGNVGGLLEQAQSLAGQELPALAALLREYRIAYKASFNRLGDVGVSYKSLDLTREDAAEGVRRITEALRAVKSDSPKGSILAETYLALAAAYKKAH